jgi:glycosyltransferase involved in cell wall biosynthesis
LDKAVPPKTERLQTSPDAKPEVSVIIPMYNAAKTLRPCLESIFSNRGVAYEVIVVNDASTDNSGDLALEFPCKLISLDSNIMSANCRNLGARHALGDILLFFDSDQVMRPDTIRRFVDVLRQNPDVDAVVGAFEADTPMPGFFSKFKNLRHHYEHQIADPEGATLASGLTAIRKSVFDLHGGFEPAYQPASIEDIALGYKLRRNNHRIRFRGDIQVSHLKGYTFTELVVSDIVNRAIPWTTLMIRDRIWKNDLNTKNANVASVALSWLIPLLPITTALLSGGIIAAACLLIIWMANSGLLRAALRHFGFFFLVKAMLFIPVMYFYQGLGLMAGIAAYAFGRPVTRDRRPPDARYEILHGCRHGAAG